MNSHDQLIIRSCKSEDPEQALKRIIKRLYIEQESEKDREHQLLIVLVDLCQKYNLCTISEALWAFKGGAYTDYLTTEQKVIDFCMMRIRYKAVEAFEGYRVPARIRNGK